MWILPVILLLVVIALVQASYRIRSGVYVKALCEKKTDRKVVALTFDDGPDPVQTPKVLEVLRRYGVPATFFCVGSNAEGNEPLLRQMVGEGHLIGNHSFSHSGYFPLFMKRRMVEELEKTDALFENITGHRVYLFRPPFGVTNPTVAAALKHSGHQVVGWNIRSFDTRKEEIGKIFRRVTEKVRPGSVILLHDRLPESDRLLEMIIIYLHDNGYEMQRIDRMFELEDKK